jgi:hypothetical protein
MNVKPLNAHQSTAALVAYQRTVRIILQRTSPPAPVSPANVVNFTEIRTPATMHVMGYEPFASPHTTDKGIFVNVWV